MLALDRALGDTALESRILPIGNWSPDRKGTRSTAVRVGLTSIDRVEC